MNIWEIDKAFLFLVLVLPGFISLKVYTLLVASETIDYSKSLVEAICYSVLNFSFFAWLIAIISKNSFAENSPILYWIAIAIIFLIAPSVWPFVFLWLSKQKIFKKIIISPYKQPWDYIFNDRESMWVAIHLKNGDVLRGKYGLNSAASAYPSEKEIYLEELWAPVENKKFGYKIKRTKGVIVLKDEISYIKFYGK